MAQTSYYQSELTDESFQSAEQNAMAHEELAKKRRFDKEQKLIMFQNKTKANAMSTLRKQQSAKKLESDLKKATARENQLKAKEFAKKQRQIVKSKGVNGAKAPI